MDAFVTNEILQLHGYPGRKTKTHGFKNYSNFFALRYGKSFYKRLTRKKKEKATDIFSLNLARVRKLSH